ncbi:hypothetical protein A3K34_02445 [candidate division WWE3 bacterium RIFOXYC1_FULL_40_10]|uniref:Ppx/GppA phosphatase N-terminal domain-containing protein n=1 Tax=candidate division WWE3 bacterium RIFOXYA2_FULL_46_9 TaxID=1802636 RepID=A0A1F4W2P8_UNCKA|nr:MAG: hypothetical protein A3K58_02445 [candidate division WWE3 bacterium RIFOXYB1_FULL_40_22]OGC61710.1 MAG: hypothetical protein A3K37_02445 [candidate division WWE3 bacterium RIFOXYA1_FULL_40_11]OGC63694.1 MAG: hypothetical protein A2264_04935 [candidate division WWE3 bacterium RIFOXYA2_FULL_46_9]OGC64884.1 MAG: hypothetical protein A2326_01270 [candidate division WWE3 bacterium RIFOXYB2_FULL_41_6]OGC66093.1 MAG: hypothetical protein A3K34_02445 [candidate division WWE3 bacterium RIFOXYC1_
MNFKNLILIDIGTTTVKAYKYSDKLIPLEQISLHFKQDFSPEQGITKEKERELFKFIEKLKAKNEDTPIKVYATSVFRKMDPKTQKAFTDRFFNNTGIFFNIVPHDLENFYLQTSLIGKYTSADPVMLINIGGGSTELVVLENRKIVETHNIDLGVGAVLEKHPEINKEISGIFLDELTQEVKLQLPEIVSKPKVAFYTGGELSYMKLAEYPLKSNSLFEDPDHPYVIETAQFARKNKEVFEYIRLETLEKLMPENPKWMAGARPCSAIAQAICQKYNIESLIPSDSNLINGVVRQEFRKVTLSGSFRKHLDYILTIKRSLEQTKIEILSPRFTEPKNPGEEFVVFTGEENMTPLDLERHHLRSIENSDALIVCDKEGYVGASAMIEIGYAQSFGKRVIFAEPPEEFMLKTLPAEIGI